MAKPWDVKHLDPDTPLASCLTPVLRTRVKEAFSYRRSAVKPGNIEAVHDMRVAMRRLIAVLTIFRSGLHQKSLKPYQASLKTLLGALGAVRDTDIFMMMLGEAARTSTSKNAPAFELVIGMEQKRRESKRTRLKKILQRFKDRNIAADLRHALGAEVPRRAAIDTGSIRLDAPFRENARTLVPHLLEAFESHREDVMTHPGSVRRLHAMRIDGKHVRYGMETFAPAFGAGYEACLEEVKTLLDVMGRVHDHDVAIERLRRRIGQIRKENRTHPLRDGRVGTRVLSGFVRELRTRRAALFREMGEILACWQRERFNDAVTRAMRSDDHQ